MIQMPVRGCLFDLDGTLIDSLYDLAAACNYALIEGGYPVHAVDEYRYMAGSGVARLLRRALPSYVDGDDILNEALAAFDDYYAAHKLDSTKPHPGINWMLQQLRALRIRLAVVTDRSQAEATDIVNRLFGRQLFDAVIGQTDDIPLKPDPAIVNAALGAMDVAPGECAYAGDTGLDMVTADAACVRGIGVLWGYRGADDLLEHGAMALVKSPDELLQLLRRWQLN